MTETLKDYFIPILYTEDMSGHAAWAMVDGDDGKIRIYDYGPILDNKVLQHPTAPTGTWTEYRTITGTISDTGLTQAQLNEIADLVHTSKKGSQLINGQIRPFALSVFQVDNNGFESIEASKWGKDLTVPGNRQKLDYDNFFHNCYSAVVEAADSLGVPLRSIDGPGGFLPPNVAWWILKTNGGLFYTKTGDKIHLEGNWIYPILGQGFPPFGDFIKAVKEIWDAANDVICPLVLDLDGDGIELTDLANDQGVFFDLNNDGFSEATAWTTGGDGILVIDLNEDQLIQGGEIFSDQTGFSNGFLALRQYDTNSDGQITSLDEKFGELKVWIDENPNGFSEEGELYSLAELSISSINLGYLNVSYQVNGNEVRQESTFTINGNTNDIVDAYLAVDPANTTYASEIVFDMDAMRLPSLPGSGVLADLYIAMSIDNDQGDPNSLISLVQGFSEISFEDIFTGDLSVVETVRTILFAWAGVTGVTAGSRGPWVDAQEVTFLEKMFGQAFQQGTHGQIPTGRAAPLVSAAFDMAFNYFYAVLATQSVGEDLFEGDFFFNSSTRSFEDITGLNLTTLGTLATEANGLSTTGEKQTFWQNVVRVIEYGYGLDNLSGGETTALEDAITTSDSSLILDDISASLVINYLGAHFVGTAGSDSSITSTSGDDEIEGLGGNDTVDGQGGHDLIVTADGNDTITGGTGDDLMFGMSGNDTYVYNLDDGNDVIQDAGGVDKIFFSAGISAADLTFSREGWDLVIDIDTGTQTGQIIINNHFYDSSYSIETIEFNDNSSLSLTGLNHVVANGTIYADVINGLAAVGGPDDEIHGGDGNDTISGLAGTDTLYGDAGNDTLDGGTGADTMAGGTGNDTYYVDNAGDAITENSAEGTDTVLSTITYTLGSNVENLTLLNASAISGTGNGLNNIITGNSAVNTLTGSAGDDTLNGGGGNDRLVGGTDNDTYIVNNSGITIVENTGEGTDTVKSSITYTLGAVTATLEVENLTLVGAGSINGTGNTLVNVITGNIGNNTLSGGTGADTLIGGKGNDVYIVDDTGDVVTELANEGTDTVNSSVTYTLSANIENLTLTGTAAINGTGNALDNTIIGTATGANILTGGDGNDWLDGLTGNDVMIGGLGDDTYVINVALDTVTENADEGIDTVRTAVTYTLGSDVENLVITVGTVQHGTGNGLDNTLIGGNGANSLSGLGGNDYIDGGLGNDTMFGGTGDDTYVVNATADVITEYSAEGTDLALSTSASYTIGANVENLTLLTSATSGTGNSAVNTLTGNDSNNTLDGAGGADTMVGGLGDDTYVVDDASDVVIEASAEGADTVQTALNNHTIAANVENLTLTGGSVLTGNGNSLDNTLTGNTAASTLAGSTGNDTYVITNASSVIVENSAEGTDTVSASGTAGTLFTLDANVENLTLTGTAAIKGQGNAGDNVINGNSGSNTLQGQDGSDTLWGGTAGTDTLDGGNGNDFFIVDRASGIIFVETAGQGTDTVLASVTHTLSSTQEIENLTLTGTGNINGTGNTLDNVITGNSGNNSLSGGTGTDTLIGGAGDDIYIVDDSTDVITENADEGTDTVQSSATSYTLSANIENLTLTGTSNISATGNGGSNSLTGNSGANTLDGAGGNDTISGGTGADSMIGGTGDDYFIVDNAGDVVIENADEGIDTVQSSISHTLATNVENLILGGTTTSGTGNASDNTITGTASVNVLSGLDGNDWLDGGAGNDTMTGGLGNDTYVIGNALEVLTENASEGTDTVISTVTWTLGNNFENLTLGGATAIHATGNADVNTLTGNTGANSLNGMAGADMMIGDAGNDTYFVDDAGDLVMENASEGTDTVQASITYTLTANVENLTLTGTANINATGNALVNTVTGNTGNNTLDGGAGADRMVGLAGDDTYIVDDENDVVVEALTSGTDLVLASASFTLAANVENLILTGSSNIDGIGNTLVNTITGNSGNNSLDGGTGADTLTGGLGDDTYVVDNAGDILNENASEGIDAVRSSITWSLAANFENLTLTGAGVINGTGNDGDNTIIGNSAKNILTGGNGNDTLEGGGGADTMAGDIGDDVYIVSTTTTVINENASEGTDTVQSSVTWTLGANIENLELTGSSNINGTGNGLDNTLTGNSWANTLDGGAGADTMIGGTGNDFYIVDDAGDVVTEAAAGGTDTVQTNLSYTLSANVENLILTGASVLVGVGNNYANTLTANTAAGTLAGGISNDTYIITNAATVITEYANEGVDTVSASNASAGTTFTLADNVENLILTGTNAIHGTGNAHNNSITGNTGNNTLIGGAGNDYLSGGGGVDTLIGGDGNDTYIVDSTTDVITENANEGTDFVSSSVNWTLGSDVENLTLTGSAVIGTGNALDNTIIGTSGTNTLTGGDGNDYLSDGNGGGDLLKGGLGDDTYFISDGTSTVSELSGQGIDTVILSVIFPGTSYTLTANVENMTMAGGIFTGIAYGNALNNIITGNDYNNDLRGNGGSDTLYGGGGNDSLYGSTGADTLDGGTGADYMSGGGGDDLFFVDNAGDTVVAGAGIVTVNSTISWTMVSNVDNLTLSGTGNINGTGNTLANVIIGNSGDNSLSGSSGNDTMDGGDGLDTLTGGANADTFLFMAATAFNDMDAITDFNTGESDKIDVSDVLDGFFNPGTDNINNFVKFEDALNGTDSIMSIDLDGTGGTYGWQQVAILNNLTGVSDAATLVASANLVVS